MKTKDAIKYLTDMAGEGSWLSKHCGDAVREVLGRLRAVEIEATHVPELRDEITQLQTALTIKNGTIDQLKARMAELEEDFAKDVPIAYAVRGCDQLFSSKHEATKAAGKHAKIYPLFTSPQQATARQVPEGWQLVPVEPTKDMVAAALCGDDAILDPYKLVVADYKAMLAAAPQAGQPGGE